MPASSTTPLVTKLGIKPHHTVFLDHLPPEVDLGELAGARVLSRLPRSIDVTLTFHTTYGALADRLPVLLERTVAGGAVWVCWPKKSAQRARGIDSDLDDDRVRRLGLDLGFVDVKVAAVDDTWSALKFVRRRADRRTPSTPT